MAAFAASLLANRLDGDVLKVVYGLTALGLSCQIFYSTWRRPRERLMEQGV